jgi:hypothetical protein
MALRLGDQVVCGEILNTRNYSVHGWIGLRGREQRVLLQLTGNPEPDLAGRHIRFEARIDPVADESALEEPEPGLKKLAWQQVGPTGTMTAARRIKVADSPPEESLRGTELGESPPTQWKRCLHLEWFSQNGHVILELIDPIIEFVEPDESATDPPSHDAGDPDAMDELAFDTDGIDESDVTASLEGEFGDDLLDDDEPSPEDDPYNLFPEDLQDLLEAETDAPSWLDETGEDVPDSIRELELMDELIERGEGEPIETIFDSPLTLPSPDQLADDAEAEPVLKSLLAQLALYGIALDVCEHYSPRDAYRLLVEQICKEEGAYPELRNTQWVQHFMTSEFCEECDAEFEREYEERERRRREEEGDDPAE